MFWLPFVSQPGRVSTVADAPGMEASPSSLQLISSLCSLNRPDIPRRASTTLLFEHKSLRPSESASCQELREGSSTDQTVPMPRFSSGRCSPKSRAVCGFIPLASIAAHPICTPALISSNAAPCDSASQTTPSSTEELSNEPLILPRTTCLHVVDRLVPPVRTSTPPTPTLRPVRRSATCLSRRSSSPFSTFASFPASMSPHALCRPDNHLKRGTSVPDMYQVSSEPFPCSKRARTSPNPNAQPLASFPSPPSSFRMIEEPVEEALMGVERPLTPPPVANRSIPSPGDIHFPEKTKDTIRRFHALKELLATEVAYLMDQRAFVTIYLRNLPTLTGRSPTTSSSFRASMSFTAGPWISSYSHLQAVPPLVTSSSDIHGISASASTPAREFARPPRYLLTTSEIDVLTRNAEDILQLHEQFVDDLRTLLSPLGFTLEQEEGEKEVDEPQQEGIENIDAAIRAVASLFITQAPRFNTYQSFCAGHTEADDLVRKTLEQHGTIWDTFEQRCAGMVSEGLISNPTPAESSEFQRDLSQERSTAPSRSSSFLDRRRAISLTSSDATLRPLRRRISGTMREESAAAFPTDVRRDRTVRRIGLMDYMMKPIQRICKYPLLLDQLKQSKSARLRTLRGFEAPSDVDEFVERAAQTMRDVAAAVNEARHKHTIATQSSLIISRIFLTGALLTQSSLRNPSLQVLTPSFFSSLGSCVIAGSLDVLHSHPLKPLGTNSPVTAKYLGAFLYPGGYLILAKVSKGKKYEPKHWFALAEFETVDVGDDDAMLAFSFRLSNGEQDYELGAACQREKDAWLAAIREANEQPPTWINEPTPSFKLDGKGDLIPSAAEEGLQRSGADTANNSDNDSSEQITVSRSHMKQKNKSWKRDTTYRQDQPSTPGNRSSASVKALFSPITPDSGNIEIRRPTSVARAQVDLDLQDILSQSCANARNFSILAEELFPAPAITRAVLPRTNSGMSISGMAKTLTRYDSVRIPKRKSTADVPDIQAVQAPRRKRGTLGSRRNAQRLSITSISMRDFQPNPTSSTRASPPSSRCSSMAPSVFPPTGQNVPSTSGQATSSTPPQHLSRRKSLARNVKGFFQSVSPLTVIAPKPSLDSLEPRQNDQHVHPSFMSRLKKGSLHRRTARDIHDGRVAAAAI